jgi:hypothetical protein
MTRFNIWEKKLFQNVSKSKLNSSEWVVKIDPVYDDERERVDDRKEFLNLKTGCLQSEHPHLAKAVKLRHSNYI